MWKRSIIFMSFCLVLLLILTACSVKEPPESPAAEPGYPSPVRIPEDNLEYPSPGFIPTVQPAYPGVNTTREEYPSPVSEETKNPASGPIFEIDEPVLAGDMQVTGTGPVGVPINLVDVSEMGLFLAETTIDSQGEFTFVLQVPLVQSHSVGLQIGDLSNTSFNYDEFMIGETYIDRPLIGILLDMVSVVEK